VAANAQTTKLMTYNIRLDMQSDGENRWENRKEMLTGQVLFHKPDFLGVQEALPNQMDYLAKTLTQYAFIGEGRDGGNKGEYSAIFYNATKYKVIEQATFWLSETPEKVSKGWDAAYNRICTYGLFEDRNSGAKIYIFNTHFDHIGTQARINSAKLILEKMSEINRPGIPFILMGDFNLEQESEGIQLLSSHLDDSKTVAKTVFGPDGTFNAFEFTKPVVKRIDYIFVPESGVVVNKYAVLSDSKDCRYPSDHLPVCVEIKLQD
jgi:endonuclease/exonuclease/phosphatase family metal-dependent hydrolase